MLGPDPFRRPAPPAVVAALLPVALLTLVALVLATGARAASLTVEPMSVGTALPPGFLGLSVEVPDLERYTGSDPRAIDRPFLHLLRQIGPGGSPTLRIGGDSTDWSWYPIAGQRRPPGVNHTITPHSLDVVRATARAIHGKVILGVNLEADNRTDAAGEARAMVDRVGRRYIEAMEIGNEPELYAHFPWYTKPDGQPVKGRVKATWTQAAYHAEYRSIAAAMPKGVTLAGPVSGLGVWLQSLGRFLRVEPSTGLVTMHAYPLKHCTASHVITIPQLLADSASAGYVSAVAPFVQIAHQAGRPIRIDEINAISCGGTAGVSDSFASALWMLNTLFGLAHTGVDGINVHTRPGTINAILNPIGRGNDPGMAVQPEYYAMIMFARAAPPGSHFLRVVGALPPGIEAWATLDPEGSVRVVLINKRASGPEAVRLRVSGATGPATVQRLLAHSLAATQGVSFGGQTFGAVTRTGELAGTPAVSTTTPFGGAYTVEVPAASAATVTLSPSPASLLLSTVTTAFAPSW